MVVAHRQRCRLVCPETARICAGCCFLTSGVSLRELPGRAEIYVFVRGFVFHLGAILCRRASGRIKPFGGAIICLAKGTA